MSNKRGYTEMDIVYMTKAYQRDPTLETARTIAVKLRKTRMSVIAKLTALGIYKRQVYRNKNGDLPRKKADIVREMEDFLGCREGGYSSLHLVNKAQLITLEGHIRAYFHELKDEILDLQNQVDTLDNLYLPEMFKSQAGYPIPKVET